MAQIHNSRSKPGRRLVDLDANSVGVVRSQLDPMVDFLAQASRYAQRRMIRAEHAQCRALSDDMSVANGIPQWA